MSIDPGVEEENRVSAAVLVGETIFFPQENNL
jgi:hypothetical protein